MISVISIWLGFICFTGTMSQHQADQMQEQHMVIAHANCVYLQNDAACSEYADLLNAQDDQAQFDRKVEELKRASTFSWR